MLKSKDDLIESLNEHETVKKFKLLEKLLNGNEMLNNKFKELKKIQKKLVNSKFYSKDDLEEIQSNYNEIVDELYSNITLNEYLNTVDEVNNIISYITHSIESAINLKD